jgi:hypothetical protein
VLDLLKSFFKMKAYLIFLISVLLSKAYCLTYAEEQYILNVTNALYNKLTTGYNKFVMPPGQINVSFQLDLIQIVSVSEKDQLITLHVSINHVWNDPRLRWNPADFVGIPAYILPFDRVWT